MRHYFIMFISIVIVAILVLSILLQQFQWYHSIIIEARKFSSRQYFNKSFTKKTFDFIKQFIQIFKQL